jgi:alkylation response protein AidB-like acyl-CoA dehydrogenase
MNTLADDETRSMLAGSVQTTLKKLGGLNLSRAIQRNQPGQADTLWQVFAEQGWLGVMVPEDFGGGGLGVKEMAVIAQELGSVGLPSAFAASAVMAAAVLGGGGVDAGAHLEALACGGKRYALAWREADYPEAEDDCAAVCARVEGGLAVQGRKTLIASPENPDHYIATARLDGELALCLLDAKDPGVRGQARRAVDGTAYQTVHLDQARVAQILARGGSAEALHAKAIEYGLLAASAELYGVMSSALKLTLEYMRTRIQFGRPIGSFQALQHRAADMFIQKDLSYSVLGEALDAVDRGVQGRERVAIVARAKARCSDAALRIAKDAVQLHGAIGYTDEYDLSCLLKRAMVLASWLGGGGQNRRTYFRAAHLQ